MRLTMPPARPGLAATLVGFAFLILPFTLPTPADAAPRKARLHAAAKPAAKKMAVKERHRKAPPRANRTKKPPGAATPRPAMATGPSMAPPPRSQPARPQRPAATVRDPGTREEARTARVACERDGRIYLLENCARSEPPALRSSQELAEAR